MHDCHSMNYDTLCWGIYFTKHMLVLHVKYADMKHFILSYISKDEIHFFYLHFIVNQFLLEFPAIKIDLLVK